MKKNREGIYIIAEVGVNHNGSVKTAKSLIDIAADAGANAVKFQMFKADALVSASAPKASYQKATTVSDESQLAMLRRLELNEDDYLALIAHCRLRKIQFLSTPFDEKSVDFLARRVDVPALKLPSGEITNGPLLLKAAQTKKPIILSTGMSTLAEILKALEVLAFGYTQGREKISSAAFCNAYKSKAGQRALKSKVRLLHSTTEYPACAMDVNLRAMNTIHEAFGLPVGYSDHTLGIAVSIAAAALGAVIIEKHFTLNRNMQGPDHKASLDPDELHDLVKSVREVEAALGSARKAPADSERKNLCIIRRSLTALQDISRGELFTEGNIGCRRPGTGASPFLFWKLIGKKAHRNYSKDEMVEK